MYLDVVLDNLCNVSFLCHTPRKVVTKLVTTMCLPAVMAVIAGAHCDDDNVARLMVHLTFLYQGCNMILRHAGMLTSERFVWLFWTWFLRVLYVAKKKTRLLSFTIRLDCKLQQVGHKTCPVYPVPRVFNMTFVLVVVFGLLGINGTLALPGSQMVRWERNCHRSLRKQWWMQLGRDIDVHSTRKCNLLGFWAVHVLHRWQVHSELLSCQTRSVPKSPKSIFNCLRERYRVDAFVFSFTVPRFTSWKAQAKACMIALERCCPLKEHPWIAMCFNSWCCVTVDTVIS